MKKITIFFALIITIAIMATSLFILRGYQMTKKGELLLKELKDKNYQKAYYNLFYYSYRDKTPFNQFKEYIKKNHLDSIKKVEWNSWSIKNSYGELEGEVQILHHKKSIKIEFINPKDWSILNITLSK